ncbi:MAG: hypothetical protein QXJ68_00960 [Methanocellales archaeon]
MDWISHLLFALTLGIILRERRIKLVLISSLLPDMDMLWHHRSELHAPLILLALAALISIQNSAFFKPVLLGFWSHSILDIFLFDNSKHTIKNIANQIVANESLAQNVENNIMQLTSADGIMLFYPFSLEKYSIILTEESYVFIAALIAGVAVIFFLSNFLSKFLSKIKNYF